MGIFGKSFKKAFNVVDKSISGGALSKKTKTGKISLVARMGTRMGSLANPMAPFSASLFAASGDGKSGRTGRAIAGAFSPVMVAGEKLATSEGQDKVRNFLSGDGGEDPPSVGAGPGVGSGTNEAIVASRRRAVAAAAARKKASQTVTTTPLGATGKADTSKKKLLGE